MAVYLGIDTSNYTTSAAAFDDVSGCVFQKKMLLPVKSGTPRADERHFAVLSPTVKHGIYEPSASRGAYDAPIKSGLPHSSITAETTCQSCCV